MNPGDVLWPITVVVLIFVAGACAAADAALSRVSRVHVEDYLRDDRGGAVALRRVIAEPPRYLNVVLLLRVAAEMTAAVMVAVWAIGRFGNSWGTVLATAAAMVVVSYVVVGVAPRTLGRQHADGVALFAAPWVVRLAGILGPLPKFLIAVGNALTPGQGFRDGPFTSEAELRDMVDLAEASKVIESDERQMIHSVFELGNTIVREVMVPRTDIVFIEQTKTLRQAMSLALRSGFSRLPVVGENEDDVVGTVYLRDITRRVFEYRESESTERVESLMRPATFVPDSKPVDVLLREMQAERIHLVIVVDEYGGTAGLATIEDILEEIVGEITDEHDRKIRASSDSPTVACGSLPGCRSTSSRSCLTSRSRTMTASRPWVACSRRLSAGYRSLARPQQSPASSWSQKVRGAAATPSPVSSSGSRMKNARSRVDGARPSTASPVPTSRHR